MTDPRQRGPNALASSPTMLDVAELSELSQSDMAVLLRHFASSPPSPPPTAACVAKQHYNRSSNGAAVEPSPGIGAAAATEAHDASVSATTASSSQRMSTPAPDTALSSTPKSPAPSPSNQGPPPPPPSHNHTRNSNSPGLAAAAAATTPHVTVPPSLRADHRPGHQDGVARLPTLTQLALQEELPTAASVGRCESDEGHSAAPSERREASSSSSSDAAAAPSTAQTVIRPPRTLCGLQTASGDVLVPLTDAEVVRREQHRMRPAVQEAWLHQSRHYLRWDEAFLKRGSGYRTNSIAARTTATMSHTKALCLSVNIDPQLLGTLDDMGDSSEEEDEPAAGGGGGRWRGGAGAGTAHTSTQWGYAGYGLDGDGGGGGGANSSSSGRAASPVFMWQSPASIPGDTGSILTSLGEELEEQYSTFAPQRPLPTFHCPNPRAADLGHALSEARKEAGDAKVIFHYYARGVPSPRGGTLFLMNSASGASSYSPYSKMPLDTLRARVDSPLVFVADCTDAGEIMRDFLWKREEQEQRQQFLSREHQLKSSSSRQVSSAELDALGLDGTGGSSGSLSSVLPPSGGSNGGGLDGGGGGSGPSFGVTAAPTRVYEDFLFIGASGCGEGPGNLPHHPRLPSDILTCCLTTPVRLAMLWFMVGRPDLRDVHPVLLHLLPGTLQDKKSPLGQLQWYLQTITECIAWSTLPLATFSRLFREDIYVAPLFRGYLLAERVITGGLGGTLSVYPPLPPTHMHPMWDVWDNLVERCCVTMLRHIRPTPSARLSTLEAREWLDVRATKWKYKQQQLRLELQGQQYRPEDLVDAIAGAGSGGAGVGGGPSGAAGGATTSGGGEAAAAMALMLLSPQHQSLLPTLHTAQLVLPNFFNEELRGVAAVVERVTQQSFRLPAVLPPGLVGATLIAPWSDGATAARLRDLHAFGGSAALLAHSDDARAAAGASGGATRSVFQHLAKLSAARDGGVLATPPGGGGGTYSTYRNTALKNVLVSTDDGEWRAEMVAGGTPPRKNSGRENEGPSRHTRDGGSLQPKQQTQEQQDLRRAKLQQLQQQQRLLQRMGGSKHTTTVNANFKDEYVPNTYILSSSTGPSGGVGGLPTASSGGIIGLGGSGVGGGGAANAVPTAFPFLERAPVLLQGLLVLAHREKATELVCRLVDAGAPAILQCAETNIFRIVLDRYWTRPDLRYLMPSTLFIYCKSCYADPDLIGPPKQRDVAIKACVGVLQCPVDVPLPPPLQEEGGDGKGSPSNANSGAGGEAGVWQHETLGHFASAMGQRLMAASLLAMLAVRSDDGREACHRVGALQVCCQLLAESEQGPNLFPVWLGGGRQQQQQQLLHTDLTSSCAANGVEAEAQDTYVLYHLALVSLLLSLLHNWAPAEGDGNDDFIDDDEEDASGEEGFRGGNSDPSGGAATTASVGGGRWARAKDAAYWLRQLEPLDGKVKELPPTDAPLLRACLRAARPALGCLLSNPVATLRGAGSKAISMVLITPAVDNRTKSVYAGSLLTHVCGEPLPPFEGNVDLHLEMVGAAYVAYSFLMEQLKKEMPLEEIRDWVAKWIYTWYAQKKKGMQPRQPCLGEEDTETGVGPEAEAATPLGRAPAATAEDAAESGSDPLGMGGGQEIGSISARPWQRAPYRASEPSAGATSTSAAAAGAGVSLLSAASLGRRVSTLDRTSSTTTITTSASSTARFGDVPLVPTQDYEVYLPPLSNLIRLFIEHAQDSCPYVVAHVRKVILDDFDFLQVPWFDQTVETYGFGTPPNAHHHHYRPPPHPPSHQHYPHHQRQQQQQQQITPEAALSPPSMGGYEGSPAPYTSATASPTSGYGSRPPFSSAQQQQQQQQRQQQQHFQHQQQDVDNATAHRHYVAALLHGITGRYAKGGQRGFGGGGGQGNRHWRRHSGIGSRSTSIAGGGGSSSNTGAGHYLRSPPSRAGYREERSGSQEHAFRVLAGGGSIGDPRDGRNSSRAGDGGGGGGGGGGDVGDDGARGATAAPVSSAASAIQRYYHKSLEPDNVTLCALSGQDATTVTSFVYAALGYLSDLLLVKQDDYDPRSLFALDREATFSAYQHGVYIHLRTAAMPGGARADSQPAEAEDGPTATKGSPRLPDDPGQRPAPRINPLCEVVLGEGGGGSGSGGGGYPGEGTVLEAVFHPILPYFTTITDRGYVHVWQCDGDAGLENDANDDDDHRAGPPPPPPTTQGPHTEAGAGAETEDPAPMLTLLSCFRPTDIYARVRSVAAQNVQLQYLYNPLGSTNAAATSSSSSTPASLLAAGADLGRRSTLYHGRWSGGTGRGRGSAPAATVIPLAAPAAARGLRTPTGATQKRAPSSISSALITGVDAGGAVVGGVSPSTASGTAGGAVRGGPGPAGRTTGLHTISGAHYVDAAYNTLLCTVRRSGSVELFSGFADPLSLRRVTTFETMAPGEGQWQHECLSTYHNQSSLLHVTVADGSVATWDLGKECLASAGYGRGDYQGFPSVLATHPHDRHLLAVGAGAVYVYDQRERATPHSTRTFASPLSSLAWRASAGGHGGGGGATATPICLHAQFSGRYPHVLVAGYSGLHGPVLLWDDRMSREPLHHYLTRPTSGGDGISGGVRHIAVHPFSQQLLTAATTAESAFVVKPFAASEAAVGGAELVVTAQPSAVACHPFGRLFVLGCGERIGLYHYGKQRGGAGRAPAAA